MFSFWDRNGRAPRAEETLTVGNGDPQAKSSAQLSSVQFSSVQGGIYTLGKAYIRSTPSLRSSPDDTSGTVPNVHLTDNGSSSSFPGRSPSASSFHASLQLIGGVLSLALCPQVVSQAPQHFRSSETQATYDGCFSSQFIDSVILLHSGTSLQAKTRHEKQKFFLVDLQPSWFKINV